MTFGLACDRDGYDLRQPKCSICGSRGCPEMNSCKEIVTVMTKTSDVREYVENYRFEFDDGGSYAPTERERAMLEDALEGYLADPQRQRACHE